MDYLVLFTTGYFLDEVHQNQGVVPRNLGDGHGVRFWLYCGVTKAGFRLWLERLDDTLHVGQK